jgi:hypothetical protein
VEIGSIKSIKYHLTFILKMIKSREEIFREIKLYNQRIERSLDFIKRGKPSKPTGQGNPYMLLSRELCDICYLNIFLEDFPSAIGAIEPMVRAKNWLYEKNELGWEINQQLLAAGNWQYLLLSLLTNNEQLIQRFCCNYMKIAVKTDNKYQHVEHSRYIGRFLSFLLTDQKHELVELEKEKKPSLDKRFGGTYEILESIYHVNKKGFIVSLKNGGMLWEKYMKKNQDECASICYLYGASFVKLAERVFNEKIDVDIPQFPKQLLEIESYTPYPLPEMIFK